MNLTKVRIRETGQVIDMVPSVATAMILGGTAEEVKRPESMTESTRSLEHAVAPVQAGPNQKPARKRA